MKKIKINSHRNFLSSVSQVLTAMNVIDHFKAGHIVTEREMEYIKVIKNLREELEDYFCIKNKASKEKK